MNKNYKFFQNKKCEYFPCHKTHDLEHFNCLFCFCPLYALGDKCGGNFKYKNDIKDCSDCLASHGKNGYEFVMSKIKEVINLGSKK